MNDYTANEIEIKNGGELVEKFCLRPKHYANQKVTLRLKINDMWSGWKIREEIIKDLNLEVGGTILTKVTSYFTIGLSEDVNDLDLFAMGEGADWLIDNKVSVGDVIDCQVQFSYLSISVGSQNKKIPKVSLIFEKGFAVIEKGSDSIKNNISEDVLDSVLKKLLPTE